jgi:hypothetical protein
MKKKRASGTMTAPEVTAAPPVEIPPPDKKKRKRNKTSKASSRKPMYELEEGIPGNLRQLRATLRDMRTAFFDEESIFSLYMPAHGKAAPELTVQQMSMAFVLRRNETRNQRNYTDAALRLGEQVPVPRRYKKRKNPNNSTSV